MLGGPVLSCIDDQRFDACWLTLSMEVCNGTKPKGSTTARTIAKSAGKPVTSRMERARRRDRRAIR